MEDIYTFELDNNEFDRVVAGKKDIQLVANSAKRKSLAVGNVITLKRKLLDRDFNVNESAILSLNATIENLLYFDNFEDAVGMLGKERCGYSASSTFDKVTDKFFVNEKVEHIEKNGIVAIIFKVKEN